MAMAYAGGSCFVNGKVCVCDELDWTIGAVRDIVAVAVLRVVHGHRYMLVNGGAYLL